jgi:AraC-like DNA-binding protein
LIRDGALPQSLAGMTRQRSGPFPQDASTAAASDTSVDALLIGPSSPLLTALRLVLEKEGLGVSTASTIQAVSRALTTRRFRIVSLDATLASVDRPSVVHMVRQTMPDAVLLYLGRASDDEAIRADLLALQPDAVLLPPYDVNEILHVMAALLTLTTAGDLRMPRVSPCVARAIAEACRDYRRVSLTAAARASGVSKGYLARRFREELALTFRAFVTRLRFEAAKDLLSHPAATLDSIAEATGFSDAAHLSRVFREIVGRPPGAYRQAELAVEPARPLVEGGTGAVDGTFNVPAPASIEVSA